MIDRAKAGNLKLIELKRLAEQVTDRIVDELSLVDLFVLDRNTAVYFKSAEPLFGLGVEDKFPQNGEDIAEAGKCLALARPTASVFRLMRVMEPLNMS